MVRKHRARKVVESLRRVTGIIEPEPVRQVKGIREKIKEIHPSKIEAEAKKLKEKHNIKETYYMRALKNLGENPPTRTKKMLYHLYTTKKDLTTRELYSKMGVKDANQLLNLFKEIRLIDQIEQGNSFKLKPSLITNINKKAIKELYPEVHKWKDVKKPVTKGENHWAGIDTMNTGLEVFGLDVETHYQLRGRHMPQLVMKKEQRRELKRKGVKREKTLNSLRQRAMEGELLERVGEKVPPGKIYLTDKQLEKIKKTTMKDIPGEWGVKKHELEKAKQTISKRRVRKIPKKKRVPKKAQLILKLLETNMEELNREHIPKLEKINQEGLDRKELIKRNIAVGDTSPGTNAELLIKKAVENELKKNPEVQYKDIIPEKSNFSQTRFKRIKQAFKKNA